MTSLAPRHAPFHASSGRNPAEVPSWRRVDASTQALLEEGLRHVDAPAPFEGERSAEAAKRVRAELLAVLGRDETWLLQQMHSQPSSLLLAPSPTPDPAARRPKPQSRTAAESGSQAQKEGRGAPAAKSVMVCPRRKALSAYTGSAVKVHWSPPSNIPQRLDFESIRPHLDLPQRLAAAHLGISVTLLKASCRKLGYPKWSEMRAAAAAQASEGTGLSEGGESSSAPSP